MATARDGVVSSQAALDERLADPPVVRGSRIAERAPTAVNRGWVQSLAPIAVFDIAAPLVAYSLLRSSGSSAATALVISGVFPAFGVALAAARNRRLDVIGAVVLVGIAVGSVIGLATGNARLLLLKGSVPTAVFGVLCLASLWSSRPLIFRFALEFKGTPTACEPAPPRQHLAEDATQTRENPPSLSSPIAHAGCPAADRDPFAV